MPVTESLSTAVLVKETRKRLGLTQLQFAKNTGSFVSVRESLGTRQDKAFANHP
jgi:transcriptional regulator with XRE-family HTH domain